VSSGSKMNKYRLNDSHTGHVTSMALTFSIPFVTMMLDRKFTDGFFTRRPMPALRKSSPVA
jgi:hypothetical protein